MPHEGEKAPDFELPTASGEKLRLSGFKGKTVVLYFYPKDDTSGCTLEAKDFSRFAPDFRKAGVEVIGLSPDSVESHQKFTGKCDLAVRLVADEDKTVATVYGVWVEKSMYGRKYMGDERRRSSSTKADVLRRAGARSRCRAMRKRCSLQLGRWPSSNHAHPAWPMMYRTLALRRTPFSVRAQPRAEIPAWCTVSQSPDTKGCHHARPRPSAIRLYAQVFGNQGSPPRSSELMTTQSGT